MARKTDPTDTPTRAPRQRMDPTVKAAEALRVAEAKLAKLVKTRDDLVSQVNSHHVAVDRARAQVAYLAANPLLQVAIEQAIEKSE